MSGTLYKGLLLLLPCGGLDGSYALQRSIVSGSSRAYPALMCPPHCPVAACDSDPHGSQHSTCTARSSVGSEYRQMWPA